MALGDATNGAGARSPFAQAAEVSTQTEEIVADPTDLGAKRMLDGLMKETATAKAERDEALEKLAVAEKEALGIHNLLDLCDRYINDRIEACDEYGFDTDQCIWVGRGALAAFIRVHVDDITDDTVGRIILTVNGIGPVDGE